MGKVAYITKPPEKVSGPDKIAYINDSPYEIHDGETVLAFVRRSHGKDLIPTLCDDTPFAVDPA